LTIFNEHAMIQPDSYVLWGRNGPNAGAYSRNAGADTNKDGVVTKAEAAQLVINRRNTFNLK